MERRRYDFWNFIYDLESKQDNFIIDCDQSYSYQPYDSDEEEEDDERRYPTAQNNIVNEFLSSDTEFSEDHSCSNLLNYMKNASLFMLSKNSKIRHFLLILVSTPEDVILSRKVDSNPDKYGIENIESSIRYGYIRILDGKIISDKNYKKYSKVFEYFIIISILISCVILSIHTPIQDPNTSFWVALFVMDSILTFIFLIEAILKMLAFGCFWNQYDGIKPYVCNPWNLLDFMVVTFSLTDFVLTIKSHSSSSLNSFKAFRAILALRPLRVVSKSENLKTLIQALFTSIPAMGNVVIICVLFLLIFAILWVEFFKGQYYRWETPFTELISQVVTYKDWYDVGGLWKENYQNFDNVLIASIVLFEMMTTEGWITVMSNGIDAAGIEKQPIYNNNEYFAILFVIFMILGWFLLINLFTAVITDHINSI